MKPGLLTTGVCIENTDVYREARSGYFVTDDQSPWQAAYAASNAAVVAQDLRGTDRGPPTPLVFWLQLVAHAAHRAGKTC